MKYKAYHDIKNAENQHGHDFNTTFFAVYYVYVYSQNKTS